LIDKIIKGVFTGLRQIPQNRQGELSQSQTFIGLAGTDYGRKVANRIKDTLINRIPNQVELSATRGFCVFKNQQKQNGDCTDRIVNRLAKLIGPFLQQDRGGVHILLPQRTNSRQQRCSLYKGVTALAPTKSRSRWLGSIGLSHRLLPLFGRVHVCAVPLRLDRPDPLGQGRMRRQSAAQFTRQGTGKKTMGHSSCSLILNPAMNRSTSDCFERSGNPGGITGKLNRGRIGQIFALPGQCRLNQPAEKSDNHDREAEEDDRPATALASVAAPRPASGRGVEKNTTENRDHENAKQHADHTNIDTHVAVEDVTEFVGNDPLQFIPRERLQSSSRHGHRSIIRIMPGSEGIDSRLLIENIDFRHGHSGSDGHLFDHVQKAFFKRIARGWLDSAAADRACHVTTTLFELCAPDQACAEYHADSDEANPQPTDWIGQLGRRGMARPFLCRHRKKCEIGGKIDPDDNRENRKNKVDHQQTALSLRLLLCFEKIHTAVSITS